MSKAIIVGDIHLSDRSPSSRTPAYTEQVLDKLRFAAGTAKEYGCPLVLAGDVFHIKAPSKNSHKLVQMTHEALSSVQTFIVPGNHDLSGDRLESLDSQPLGALCRMDNVCLLLGATEFLPGISGLPYLTEFDSSEWWTAVEDWQDAIGEPELLVTHAPIFPPGQAPGVYYSIDPDQWADVFTGIPATYYGHIHECHGTFTDTKGYMKFCNQGALSRGSLHESSIARKPAITYWNDGDLSFTRIEVPHLPADEVFLFEQAAKALDNKASAEEFAATIGSTQIEALTFEGILAILKSEVKNKEVMTVIESVLEEVR